MWTFRFNSPTTTWQWRQIRRALSGLALHKPAGEIDEYTIGLAEFTVPGRGSQEPKLYTV